MATGQEIIREKCERLMTAMSEMAAAIVFYQENMPVVRSVLRESNDEQFLRLMKLVASVQAGYVQIQRDWTVRKEVDLRRLDRAQEESRELMQLITDVSGEKKK